MYYLIKKSFIFVKDYLNTFCKTDVRIKYANRHRIHSYLSLTLYTCEKCAFENE